MHPRLESLIALTFLFIMLVFGYLQTQAPAVQAESDLDYARLNQHIDFIAGQPHPMGSDANRVVRDYIVSHFESLGLSTEIQKTTVVYRHPSKTSQNTTIANVENIIARLPGKAPEREGNALVLLTHYDSRPLTPGAADDASGTATVMEVARLMTADPAPAHDVLFVITDGEEMGLLGAQGFFRQHPAANEVGLVLNLEARGSSGVSTMFETSENNDWLVENLAASAPKLVADSLSYEIYRRMPNDTDMTISKGEGVAGLNFAFVGSFFDYHAMTDTPANLDQRSMAQQANYMLATARHFAQLENWQAGAENVTYFNLWPGQLVIYSKTTAIVIGLLVLGFGLWVFITGLRAKRVRLSTVGSGFLAILTLVSIVSNLFESVISYQFTQTDGIARLISLGEWPLAAYFTVLLGICLWFTVATRRGIRLREVFLIPLFLAVLAILGQRPWADAPITLAVLVPLLFILSRRRNPPDIATAGLVLWWLMAGALLYLAPNASYIAVWPLLSVLLVLGFWKPREEDQSDFLIVPVLLASFVPLLFLAYLVIMAYLALGSTLPQMIMIVCVIGLVLVWPLVQAIAKVGEQKSGYVVFALGILLTLIVMFGGGFDTRHPQEQELFLAVDVDREKQYWVSADATSGSWAGDYIGEQGESFNMDEILPGYRKAAMRREVSFQPVEAASVSVTAEAIGNGRAKLTMQLRSRANAEYINLLFPSDAGIIEAGVNGFDVPVPKYAGPAPGPGGKPDTDKNSDRAGGGDWWRWRWYGLPKEGAEITLLLKDEAPIDMKIVEVDYGMPAGAPTRPENVMARKYTWSDSTVIFQTLQLQP
jgi:hypothetical protein